MVPMHARKLNCLFVRQPLPPVPQHRNQRIGEETKGVQKLFGVKWIQFIDSGGQIQYHKILTRVPGVVLNLSQEPINNCFIKIQ